MCLPLGVLQVQPSGVVTQGLSQTLLSYCRHWGEDRAPGVSLQLLACCSIPATLKGSWQMGQGTQASGDKEGQATVGSSPHWEECVGSRFSRKWPVEREGDMVVTSSLVLGCCGVWADTLPDGSHGSLGIHCDAPPVPGHQQE